MQSSLLAHSGLLIHLHIANSVSGGNYRCRWCESPLLLRSVSIQSDHGLDVFTYEMVQIPVFFVYFYCDAKNVNRSVGLQSGRQQVHQDTAVMGTASMRPSRLLFRSSSDNVVVYKKGYCICVPSGLYPEPLDRQD